MNRLIIYGIFCHKIFIHSYSLYKTGSGENVVGYMLEMSVSNIGSAEEFNEFIHEFGCKNESSYTLTNSSKKEAFNRGSMCYFFKHYSAFC